MRRMASDARLAGLERGAIAGPRSNRMIDLLGVAARAGARRVVVRSVAGRALCVGFGREHRPAGVARDARLDLGFLEVVRRMTAGARGMTGGTRGVGDEQRRLLPGMAARASLIGGRAGFVNAVAVDAAARAGVARLLLGVTLRAWLGSERRRLVRAMAAFTFLVGV